MEPLTFVYVFPVRLEFEMKTNLDCAHPASDGCFRKKKNVILLFLEETDPGPTEIKKMHLLGKSPCVAG